MKLFRIFPRTQMKRDPDALLRLFLGIAVVSVIVITSLAGYAFHQVLQRHVVASAEEDAIHLSRALLVQERARITAPLADGSLKVAVGAENLPGLDRQLRQFLSPFEIVKIKIYSSDYRIVYSTEKTLIGQVDDKNVRLANALRGEFDSKLERKEEVKDLADELKFGVDVVETYIPIRDNGRVIGSFEVYIDVTRYRAQVRRGALLSLGILAAIMVVTFGSSFFLVRRGVLELKKVQELLRKQTITDALTGTFNKSHIELVARREFSRAQRRREKGQGDADLGLIMIDIDRFKEVNDTYGHVAGDVLLRQFTERIAGSLRSYDHLGRFGGEEFLIVLPGTDLEQARQVAQKIWSLIREKPFTLEERDIPVTASAGVCAFEQGFSDYLQFLKCADERLYLAKSGGRDRVV